jgi:Zn-dependent M16 (insulinase) family peptidase
MIVAALGVILVYLAGSSVSPLENVIVEKEQIASAVYYSTDTRPDIVIWFTLSSVATKDLSKVEARFFEVLKEVLSKPLNLQYMSECISRSKRQIKSQVEESGNLFAENVICDFLFGKDDGSTLHDLKTLKEYDELDQWKEEKWKNFIEKWISDASHVSVLGIPSAAMSQRLKDEEESRVAARKEKLGDNGLKKLGEKLEAAKAENDKEIPKSLLERFEIPGVESIKWIETITARSGLARKMGHLNNKIQNIINTDDPDLPLFIHFEHVPSNFVHFTLLISTSSIPLALRPLLPLYFDNFFNTPISRDGESIPFEQVVMELEEATVSYTIGEGSRIGAPENIRISFHIEPERYSSAIEWLRQMLSESIFDETVSARDRDLDLADFQ